jgi:hypothetical protein
MPSVPVARAATGRALGRIVALAASLVIVVAAVAVIRSLGSAAQPVTLSAMPAAAPRVVAPDVVVARALGGPATLHGGVRPEPAVVSAAFSMPADIPSPAVAAENAAPMLSGEWTLTNEVQSTNFKAFEGLQLEYRLTLSQDGVIVTGRGEKWSENGREIPSTRRTPISVAGTLYQNRLELSFTEAGTRRTSAGRFVWQVSDDGEMRGTFSSDAAARAAAPTCAGCRSRLLEKRQPEGKRAKANKRSSRLRRRSPDYLWALFAFAFCLCLLPSAAFLTGRAVATRDTRSCQGGTRASRTSSPR